ncbi:hypothetical protein ACFYP8_34810 [Streptomyces hirsutus]|uniref:hypothetical protein n=1 Tax=Streptomyces hirsutus TaxID=35620 RepID=UPI003674D114
MTGRPPKGRTWGRRGITPRVKVSGRSRGRLSVAGLLCYQPGLPARLCYRLRRHTGRKDERRSLGEMDYIRLLDGAHQLLKAPLIVVWDRLSTHISVQGTPTFFINGQRPQIQTAEDFKAAIEAELAK